MRSSTTTLIEDMRILGRTIVPQDGIANAMIAEAAERLQELQGKLEKCKAFIADRVKCKLVFSKGGYHGRRLYLEAEKFLREFIEVEEACK